MEFCPSKFWNERKRQDNNDGLDLYGAVIDPRLD